MSTLHAVNTVHFANEVRFNQFKQISIEVIPENRSVWVYMDPQPRACMNRALLKELREFQALLKQHKGQLSWKGELVDIEYHVITSNHPVFNFGGDLDYFLACIENAEREKLTEYAYECIETFQPNYEGFDLDITTISLVNGNALGGGFEAALSSHVVIAEKHAEMGLPEVLFNLFPGMGAYNLLAQRMSPHEAEKLMMSGSLYSAEDMFERGVVDVLAEEGEGRAAVNAYIRANAKRSNTHKAIRKVRQSVCPIEYDNLIEICDIWVDAAMKLSQKDLRTIKRLVRSQNRFSDKSVDDRDIKVESLYS